MAGDALIANNAEGINVAGAGGELSSGLFGRKVLCRSHDLARLGQWHLVGQTGNAKIGDLNLVVRGDKQVTRLHIAVDQSLAVRH